MSRTAIEVDRDYLTRSIKEAEKDGPLKGFSQLFEKVAEIYNGKVAKAPGSIRAITPAIAGLRIKGWGIKTLTQKGKRGRSGGFGTGPKGVRVKKGEKFASNPEIVEALKKLKESTPAKYHPLVDQVANGSRKAADKLKCLACSCYQPIEVKNCPVKACALWPFRSKQLTTSVQNVTIGETDDTGPEDESEELVS